MAGAGGAGPGASAGAGGDPTATGGVVGAGGFVASAGALGDAGAGGAGGASDGCNTKLSPSVEPCMATNAHALFVAPNGVDTAAGTRERPLRSLTRAVQLASLDSSKVVIACNAAFRESISIGARVRLYGGYGCPGTPAPWVYQPNTAALLAPNNAGPALAIRDVTGQVVLEDFEILPEDALEPGASSIAVSVVRSTNVTFRRTKITAGKGAEGAPGVNGVKGADGLPPSPDQNGTDACTLPAMSHGGLPDNRSTCVSHGGKGAIPDLVIGGDGEDGMPFPMQGLAYNGGKNGGDGGAGVPGDAGTAGSISKVSGMFSDAGYSPAPDADGGSGADGFPGQGGGGGDASVGSEEFECVGAGGGTGGMGGCGGKAGTGGKGGGASIALLLWDSTLTLEVCKLTAAEGGMGGKGGDGAPGGNGAKGGLGGAEFVGAVKTIAKGGNGGLGGPGGPGGPGAGGMGGPSLGIVVHGAAPIADLKTTVQPGKPGVGGPGGTSGVLVKAPSGLDGFVNQLWSAN